MLMTYIIPIERAALRPPSEQKRGLPNDEAIAALKPTIIGAVTSNERMGRGWNERQS
jgi:hypothetical protein